MSVSFRDISIRSDIHRVDPRLIKVEPEFNPRDYSTAENQQHILDLKESIRELGVKVPLLVRWNPKTAEVFVVDGESRLNAVLALIEDGVDIKTVPVIQETTNNPAERLAIAMAANNSRHLTDIEKGRGYKRLLAHGWDIDHISRTLGVSKPAVTQGIALAEAPDEVQNMVSTGQVSAALARKALKTNGDGATEVLKAEVLKAHKEGRVEKGATVKLARSDVSEKQSLLEMADQIVTQIDLATASPFLKSLVKEWNDRALKYLLKEKGAKK